MTEWGVVGVIVVLIGLGVSIIKPIVALTKSITELTVTMQGFQHDLDNMTLKNTESHRRIWEHNDDQDEKIQDHETRIQIIERERGEDE